MKKQLLSLFIATATLIVGCQTTENENPIPTPNAKKLLKITESYADQSIVSNLGYDANGRFISMKDPNKETTYSYDANGNIIKIQNKYSPNYSSVFEITYKNGIPETAVLKMYSGTTIDASFAYTYKVENGLVTEINLKDDENHSTKFSITYQNGNVAKIESISDLRPGDKISTIFTYGTKKNMYSAGSFKFILDDESSVSFFAKNEITQVKNVYIGSDAGTYETNNTYTYDTEGYPLTSISTPSSHTFKYEYQ